MAKILVDNQSYEVPDGQNLLHVCLSLGFNLPYFCWHPALGSVGACRQCAVKQFRDENDTRGRLVMACMTPAANGARISIADPEAREFRASVIEGLMVNHPHDCPVCDEGSECHLQDMTVMTGHDYRRYRGLKRTYRNQYLGPFVNHEMNRCIQCYRCVRFYRDYAGGRDLDAFVLRNLVYFGRAEDGVLQSEFSGNLVEVCPTGVFTDKTLKRHYTRKWDLQTAPSVCVHCSLGCNTLPGERYGTLRRVRNRYNGQVNGYFVCDRGRYGYEFVNSERRIREPLCGRGQGSGARGQNDRGEGSGVEGQSEPERFPVSRDVALQHAASLLASPAAPQPPGSEDSRQGATARLGLAPAPLPLTPAIGIGSPRASLEANFALRALVGPERFYMGVSDTEARLLAEILEIMQRGPARSPSLREVEQADTVLVLGEDVSNTAPVLALALRQSVRRQPIKAIAKLRIPAWDDAAVREAIQQRQGPFYIAALHGTRLDEIATETYRAAPDDLARLGFAVAHALGGESPAVPDLPAEARALTERIAGALQAAERPLVVSGTGCRSEAVLQAAASIVEALSARRSEHEHEHEQEEEQEQEQEQQQEQKPAPPSASLSSPPWLCFVVLECNSLGLALMGGESLEGAFQAVREGAAETVIILENDLYRRAEAGAVDSFLAAARHVIVLDHLANGTADRAEVVLPAATFAEADGTLVNNEGRAQRFYQVFVPAGDIQESWRWLRDLRIAAGGLEADAWPNLDAITAAMVEALPVFAPVPQIAPPASFRIAGEKIPREPHRFSGRTAITANITVHEPRPPADPDSALAFTMEGYLGEPPPALIPRFWSPGWNSVQALNKFQSEVGGPLRGGDPGRRLIEGARGGGGEEASEPRPSGSGTGAEPRPSGSGTGSSRSTNGTMDSPAPVPLPDGRGSVPPSPLRSLTPSPFAVRPDEWLLVPIYHVFGSEELSMLTPGIAELAPEPYVALHPEEAGRLQVGEGDEIEVQGEVLPTGGRQLPVRLMPTLPWGLAGLPAGLPGLVGLELPAWSRLRRPGGGDVP